MLQRKLYIVQVGQSSCHNASSHKFAEVIFFFFFSQQSYFSYVSITYVVLIYISRINEKDYHKIPEISSKKLKDLGFSYRHGLEDIIYQTIICCLDYGYLPPIEQSVVVVVVIHNCYEFNLCTIFFSFQTRKVFTRTVTFILECLVCFLFLPLYLQEFIAVINDHEKQAFS